MTDFGAPVPVAELPARDTGRGGKPPITPALSKWIDAASAKPGVYELASTDKDGAHTVGRVTQMRSLLKERTTPEGGNAIAIETRPVVTGKRYRIFAVVTAPSTNGKGAAK